MLRSYLPAIVFLIIGVGIGGLFVALNRLLGPRAPRIRSHNDPYESGLPSEVRQAFRVGISFYKVAMLFTLFEIDVVFLYPIAVQLRHLVAFALTDAIAF